ncbi:MAG TPA: hypothetical protein VH280_10845 [Verrucomicrobiae bacterium]|nr:hypothetical protein [Verrucomicrobiae bacterium]
MNGNTIRKLVEKSCAVLFLFALTFGMQLACRAQLSGSALTAVTAAAEAGNPAAQDKLAGDFVRHRNFLEAELWYRKAAKQGFVHAQATLGEMLLANAGLNSGQKPKASEAIGLEAIKWLTLAANASNTLAQAELAGVDLNGQFVKPDLLESYKWGDIASKSPPSVPGSNAGRSVRDAATLKMSFDEISKAKQRVATFYSHVAFVYEPPDPKWVSDIKLTGISGPVNARLAIINNQTFATGDSSNVKVSGQEVQVHCLEIREKSAVVKIAGVHRVKLLVLAEDQIKK